ncbi:glutathione S-transferase family protein [Aurantiacibacter poecillastricola]|uniref:glutathione S-transferase family protein n=1 Tax=Aurantiacibacter poecillastricola TaxID=3064385 RepID=UPI00273DD45A|nr:glutathione S-transferase family protein [Aurantiacibacter sp. 219JJ12-13]MDP5261281.1 glutathione S-transferase family protein [Aurantiacibacter sp. 219JJ12-13]
MMRLWFAPQTCARVTLTALEEIGEPFETRLIAFMAGDHRKPEFLSVNPAGKVPALETAEGVIVQNGAILTYLAQVYPAAGLLPQPEDAAGRAYMLAELFRCSSDLHPLVTRFVMSSMMSTDAADAPRIRAKAAEGLAMQLAPLEHRLAEQSWMLGEAWSILDAYLAWIWFRVTAAGFEADRYPSMRRHYSAASERPSARAALLREDAANADLKARGLFFTPQQLTND